MRRLGILIFILLIVSTGGCVAGDDFSTFITDITNLLNEIAQLICDINEAVQLIVGVVGSFVIVLAGLKWLASQDNPQERQKSKEMLKAVLVGLVLVMSATSIVGFMLGANCT